MKFLAQLGDTKPAGWIEVFAETEQDAAIQTLRLVSARQLLPVEKLLPCTVYVSDHKHYEKFHHEDGAPFMVHAFKLERSN